MTRATTNIALTTLVALYALFILAGSLCLASVLPGACALLVLPLLTWNGLVCGDLIGKIWQLEGQYDDETV
jgi:hypothetical protein